jgi:hypothetical protein
MGSGSGLPDLQGLFADLGKWSRLGMHVKRWILLLVISCTAISLGIAFLLVQVYRTQPFPEWVYYVTLQNLDRTWRALIFFVFGVGGVGFSVVQLNRSLLLAVQPPYEQGRLVDIVYNYRLPQRRPHVVALAGHRGFIALQHHRERYADRLTGISSVGDGLIPPAIEVEIARDATDRVLQPVDEHVTLCAELEHGTILIGADAIRARRGGVPIKRVFLVRPGEDTTAVARAKSDLVGTCLAPVKPDILQAIAEADVILFGPGAFYVSILPNLLLAEISDAIRASSARKVLIANLMTEPGQTDLYDVGDYVRAVHAYGGFTLDYVVVNSAYGDRVLNERYAASLATPVFAENSADGASGRSMRKVGTEDGAIVIAADIARRMAERVPIPAGSRDMSPGGATTTSIAVYRHDPAKLASVLATLLGVSETR